MNHTNIPPAMPPALPLSLLQPPSLNDPRPLVLYHGRSCPDGFAAALAAWLFFGDRAEYRSVDHGDINHVQDLGDVDGRAVYVLDFAFAPVLMAALEDRVARLVVLDHHQSACDRLAGFACRRAFIHFDMAKSGARLAWEFFHPHQPVPALVRHVEDRDLWKWELPDSAAFLAALDMVPRTMQRWAEIAAFSGEEIRKFIQRGAAMDEKFQQLCLDMAHAAQPVSVNGFQGLMLNCPSVFHSQVGDLLARQSGSFALMWHANGQVVKVGLRSRGSFNCIALAESFGGGGHPQACGFRIPFEKLPALLAGALKAEKNTEYPVVPAPALVFDSRGQWVWQ